MKTKYTKKYLAILKEFGSIERACEFFELNFRTLKKHYMDNDSPYAKKKIEDKGYNPNTFKPLER
jgi:hypothetical protein